MRGKVSAAVAAALLVGYAGVAAAQGSGGVSTHRAHASTAETRSAAAAPRAARVDGPVKVNDFMSFDPEKKVVTLEITASYNSANGGMNFNGGARGSQTITVPEGWTVRASFQNKDAIPHSAIIIDETKTLPAQPQDPAFPAAYTRDVTAGIPTGGTDQLNFKASKAGNYLIVCGVPGHAPSGMWIHFNVSADAAKPDYSM